MTRLESNCPSMSRPFDPQIRRTVYENHTSATPRADAAYGPPTTWLCIPMHENAKRHDRPVVRRVRITSIGSNPCFFNHTPSERYRNVYGKSMRIYPLQVIFEVISGGPEGARTQPSQHTGKISMQSIFGMIAPSVRPYNFY